MLWAVLSWFLVISVPLIRLVYELFETVDKYDYCQAEGDGVVDHS